MALEHDPRFSPADREQISSALVDLSSDRIRAGLLGRRNVLTDISCLDEWYDPTAQLFLLTVSGSRDDTYQKVDDVAWVERYMERILEDSGNDATVFDSEIWLIYDCQSHQARRMLLRHELVCEPVGPAKA
jgi:hypothetical protein